LDIRFPQKWIDRGGPITWPLCSPDLTPADFLFWGHIKNAVYIPSVPTTLPELAGRIYAAVAAVTPSMLTNVWTAPEYTYVVPCYPH